MTFFTQIATVLAHIGASIVIARVLGPDGKGVFVLVTLVPTVLALVVNMGIGHANVYFGGTERYGWGDLASNSVVSAVGLGLLSAVAFLIYFLVADPSFLRDVELPWMVVGVVAVPFSLIAGYLGLILVGQGRVGLYNVLQIAPAVLSMLLTVAVLLVLHAGILGVVAIWTGNTVVCALLSVLLVYRGTTVASAFDWRLLRESVKFGFPVSLGNTIQFFNYRVDMLIVASLMSAASVGYYSVSVATVETLWYLPAAVGTMVLAKMPSLGVEEANRSAARICRNTLLITILAGLALLAVGRYLIIILYGSAFLPALRPLWLLVPGVVALTIWKVLPPYMVARGKPAIMSIGAGVSLVVNVVLNLVLVPRMGISGAALASTVSYSVTAILVLVVFLRMSGCSCSETLFVKRDDLRMYVEVVRRTGGSLLQGTVKRRTRETIALKPPL